MLLFMHAAAIILLLFMPLFLRIDSVVINGETSNNGEETKSGVTKETKGEAKESKLSEGNMNQRETVNNDPPIGEDHSSIHQPNGNGNDGNPKTRPNQHQYHHVNKIPNQSVEINNKQHQKPRGKHMPLPNLNPFFPPGVFHGIKPNRFGGYLASVPDPIAATGKHIWTMAENGNNYHQLPNGDLYKQDAKGKNWIVRINGQNVNVPLKGPLPPFTGPFLPKPALDMKVPAEPPLGIINYKNTFNGIGPNQAGNHIKIMEDEHIYRFIDGIVYCHEPDDGEFYMDLRDENIFYRTPDRMHKFMYLQIENVPVNVPAADGRFTSADDGHDSGVKWSIIWIPHQPSLEDICPKNLFDGVPKEGGSYMKKMEDGHIYEKRDDAAYRSHPDGGIFFVHLVDNGKTFYLTPDGRHIFMYLPEGRVNYVNAPEHINNPSASDDPEVASELAWLDGILHGHDGQREDENQGGVRITETNEDGTPKEDAVTVQKHFGHAMDGDKKKDDGYSKKPGSIEIKKNCAGMSFCAGGGAPEKKRPPSSAGSNPESPRERDEGGQKTPTRPGLRSPQSRSPPASGKPKADELLPAGVMMIQHQAINEEREQPLDD